MTPGNPSKTADNCLLLVATCLVASCHTISNDEFSRLQNWLTCGECIDGERQYAKDLGGNAVGVLDSALIGPSQQRKAVMRAKLGDSYRFANRPGGDSNAYINPRFENFVATYQKRAAISLGDIGNDDAKNALDRAIRESVPRGYRSDVIRTIRFVRRNAGGAPFQGQIRPGQVSYGEIVSVVAPPGQHFSPQVRAAILGSPFPPDQIPYAVAGDTLRLFAVGDAGPHTVLVTDGPRLRATQIGSVTIGSLLDASDRSVLNCAPVNTGCAVAHAPRILATTPSRSDTAASATVCRTNPGSCVVHVARLTAGPGVGWSPLTIFLALTRKPPRQDTVDFLKVDPVTNLPLTAVLDWRGTAKLNLGWLSCTPPFDPVGKVTVTTFAAVESTSVVVPAGQCWILQVSMSPGVDGPAFARLRIRTP